SADMETVAGVLLALTIYLESEGRPAGWRIIAFWLAMALTSLTKGLLGFALPLLIVGIHASLMNIGTNHGLTPPAIDRRPFGAKVLSPVGEVVNSLVRKGQAGFFIHRATLLAVPLALLVYFLPFALSGRGIADRGLSMVFRENLQRFFNPVNHKGPIYLYAWV